MSLRETQIKSNSDHMIYREKFPENFPVPGLGKINGPGEESTVLGRK